MTNDRDHLTQEDLQFIEDANADVERLQQDREAWARYVAEQNTWDALASAFSPPLPVEEHNEATD